MGLKLKKSIFIATVCGGTMLTSSAAFADMAPVGPFDSCDCSTIYQTGGELFPMMAVVMLAFFALSLGIWGWWRHRKACSG